MNWTTTSTTVVIGALIVAWLLAGLIVWKVDGDDWYVPAWFGGAGAFLLLVVIILVCVCQAQTDQIRAIKCRQEATPGVLSAHPEWSAEEVRAVISKVCP